MRENINSPLPFPLWRAANKNFHYKRLLKVIFKSLSEKMTPNALIMVMPRGSARLGLYFAKCYIKYQMVPILKSLLSQKTRQTKGWVKRVELHLPADKAGCSNHPGAIRSLVINSLFSCRLLQSPRSYNYDFRQLEELLYVFTPSLWNSGNSTAPSHGGWNSHLREGRHTGHVQTCPQLTTFLAVRDYCLWDIHVCMCVICCKHSYPWATTNSWLWSFSKITGLTEPHAPSGKQSELNTIFFLPLSTPHRRAAIVSYFGMCGNCFLYASLWIQIFSQIGERQKRVSGPQLKTSWWWWLMICLGLLYFTEIRLIQDSILQRIRAFNPTFPSQDYPHNLVFSDSWSCLKCNLLLKQNLLFWACIF